ncbi:MAG: ferredoxin [Acidobacteriota bacterium]
MTLQELAGVKNVYVERAVERVRQETLQEALAELEKSREEARRAGAEEAIGRLAAVLSDLDSLDRALPSQAAVAAPPAEQAPAVKPAPSVEEAGESAPAVKEEAAAEEEEEDFGAEAYIDSFLCTSCNECINLNPRMFNYNGDRQAFVADPSAGNYAELVKAAEACPARCIHPGAPRAGDDTATPEVVERGKAFR